MSFNISFPSDTERNAYRASIQGLTARLPGGTIYSVKDLSVTGVSLICPPPVPPTDRTIPIDLLVSNRLYLAELESRLVRGGAQGIAAFAFVDLTQKQEERLDKLVLTIQKQMIEAKKVRGK